MARVCIIVPVYNVENYLNRCVDSLLNQTFTDFEIILVDDGSPDRSGAICDSYAVNDTRIHVIHQENGGLSATRNIGLDWSFSNSNCIWISFVDSDDWVHPRFLEALLSAVEKDNTDMAIGDALWTTGDALPEDIDSESKVWKPEDYFLHDATNATVSWGKLYRKGCFKNIRFPVGKIHEDEFVTYQILFKMDAVSVIDAPLYAYYQNENGIMKSPWTAKRLSIMEALEKQIEFFLENGYEEIAKERFHSLIINGKAHQQNILDSENLTRHERRKYTNEIKRQLRRMLIKCHKYGWFPFKACEDNKQVYMNAFMGIRVGRNVWARIKPVLKNIPGVRFAGEKLKNSYGNREEIRLVWKYFKSIRNCDAILLQTPLHGNVGDHAIAEAEIEFLKKMKIPTCDFPWSAGKERLLAKVTPSGKIILVTGGGYLGQLWPEEEKRFRETVKAYRRNRIIVFPQTIWFDLSSEEGKKCLEQSREVYGSHPNLTMFVREKYSLQFMQKYMPEVKVGIVPDMVMGMDKRGESGRRSGALICVRNDREGLICKDEYQNLINLIKGQYHDLRTTDTVISEPIKIDDRDKVLDKKLQEFSNSQIVITDRLHGMIFAAITETPCIVLKSLSHKVYGCYEWVKDLGYIRIADNIEEIPGLLSQLEQIEPHYNYEKMKEYMRPLYKTLKDIK